MKIVLMDSLRTLVIHPEILPMSLKQVFVVRRAILVAFSIGCLTTPAFAALSVADVGLFTLSDLSGGGAGGLSGLTYSSGSSFYAVDDSSDSIYPVNLNINLTSGAISSGSIGAPLQLKNSSGGTLANRDQEGIAFNPVNQSVWVSHEGDTNNVSQANYVPTVTEHRLSDGHQIGSRTLPAVYTNQALNGVRINMSLESITRNSSGVMWTANEEALNQDGDPSGANQGTTVRLTRFNAAGNANGQYAYDTGDTGDFPYIMGKIGVSDLMVLPDGKLIALERAVEADFWDFDEDPDRYHIRLFQVDLTGATDISGQNTLGSHASVGKTLLWDHIFSLNTNGAQTNFEGLALGPQLANGDYSVVLVADNDGSPTPTNHNFYALRLGGVMVPEPAAITLFAGAVIAIMGWHLRARSRRIKAAKRNSLSCQSL